MKIASIQRNHQVLVQTTQTRLLSTRANFHAARNEPVHDGQFVIADLAHALLGIRPFLVRPVVVLALLGPLSLSFAFQGRFGLLRAPGCNQAFNSAGTVSALTTSGPSKGGVVDGAAGIGAKTCGWRHCLGCLFTVRSCAERI